jgi:hypothetical protein
MAKKTVEPGPRRELLAKVEHLLSELASIQTETLARVDDLSNKINFTDAVPVLTDYIDLYKDLSSRDLKRLPIQQLQSIQKSCDITINLIKTIKQFDLNTNNPLDSCNSIINDVKQNYDGIVNPLLLTLAFTATSATDYARIEREAKGCLASVQAEREAFNKYITDTKNQADSALAAIKQQAAEAGVSTNGQLFADNANVHNNQAYKWMAATVIVTSVTLLVAIGGVYFALVIKTSNIQESIQFLVSKIILLSTLSFMIFWCSKNYRAQKHNETLNQHRANALRTFRAFVEGTSDPAVKDAILLHAAQAAFAPRHTGYDSQDSDQQPINPVVEVFGKSLPKSSTS